jgi:LysR family transcriptional regulator, benzoate and cis,cis-muconate-responsive activator of ben and cat genes
MELKHLRYFKAVAEELNFRKAAEKLHMSQPPLSQQIKELESSLGVSLFQRLKNGNKLTEAGKILYQYTVEIFERAELAEEHIKAIREKKAGRLLLGLVPGIRPSRIVKALSHFRRSFPHIDVAISENCTTTLVTHILDNQLDLAIVFGPVDNPAVEWTSLGTEEYKIVLPRNHPLAKRRLVTPKDLRDESLILYKRQDQPFLYDALMQLLKSNGNGPRVVNELSSPRTRVLLVHQGLGLTFAPYSLQEEYPHVVFKSFSSMEPVPLGILRKRSKYNATIRDMIEAFREA